jgi:hypothetical protein
LKYRHDPLSETLAGEIGGRERFIHDNVFVCLGGYKACFEA